MNEWSTKHAWWWETQYTQSICFIWKEIKVEKSADSRWFFNEAEEGRTRSRGGKLIMDLTDKNNFWQSGWLALNHPSKDVFTWVSADLARHF